MRRLLWVPVGVLLLAAAAPARAGVDIDFGVNVPAGDDTQLFFAISSRYFDQDRAVVTDFGARWSDPDDLAVGLFIGQRCGRPPRMIFDLRRQGLSWWDISLRLGVPIDAWFVPVARLPGPPFGHAYGFWRKHQRNRRFAFRLTDRECRDLVAARFVHEYYGIPVETAMTWRARGQDVRTLVVQPYRGRHGSDKDRETWRDRYENPEKEHGRGHGKKRDHDRGDHD